MIKKTVAILLMIAMNSPLLCANAAVTTMNEESIIKDQINNTTMCFYTSEAQRANNVIEAALKKAEDNKIAEQKQEEQEKIYNENTRKNNVHVYASDVTSVSGITTQELSDIFYKLNKPKMVQYADAFVDAEKEYKVNALFLAAIAAQESGWGTKAGGTNGTNLTGHCVYNSSSIGTTFNSGYESIMETAKLLKDKYLTAGAKNYHGTSVEDVNTDYCLLNDMKTTDYRWTGFVTSIENLLEKTYHHEIKTLQ